MCTEISIFMIIKHEVGGLAQIHEYWKAKFALSYLVQGQCALSNKNIFVNAGSKYPLPANWNMFITVVIKVLVTEVNSVGTDTQKIVLKEDKNKLPAPKNLHFLMKTRTRTEVVNISCSKQHRDSQGKSWKYWLCLCVFATDLSHWSLFVFPLVKIVSSKSS